MIQPQNGDTNICEACQQPIDYRHARWHHTNGEAGQRHQAWPGQTRAPGLVCDDFYGYVKVMQIAPEGSHYAWW